MILAEIPAAEVRFFTPTEDFLAEHQTLKIVLHLDYYQRKPLSLPKELARTAQCALPFGERLVEAVAGDTLQCDRGGVEDWLASRDPEKNPWGRVVVNSEPGLNPESRVTLAEERDPLGLRRIRLDWQTLPVDDRTIHDDHPRLRRPPRRPRRGPGAALRLGALRDPDPGDRARRSA